MADHNPSAYEISKCIITSYDGSSSRDITSNFVGGFEISQSMFSTSYSGVLSILDGAGVLDGLPIRGEETLELDITTFDQGEYTVKLIAHVWKISNIVPSTGSDAMTYNLHFMSRASFFAATNTNITEGFKTSISFCAQKVFDKYFGKLSSDKDYFIEGTNRIRPYQTARISLEQDEGRSFVVQPTVGITTILMPDISGQEAMYMLASRAYNPDTPSLSYRFFETFENFYFCTDEYFIKDVRDDETQKLFYAPVVDYDGPAEGNTQRIESLEIVSKGIDTVTDIYSGSYRSKVTEIDFVRGAVNYRNFNYDNTRYIDMSGTPRDLNFNPHTERFRQDMFREDNAKQFTVFRDHLRNGDTVSSLRNEQHLSEIIQNRTSYYYHLNNTSLGASLMGRLDLRPGQIVELDLLSLSGLDQGQGLNKTMSGRYLIQTVSHSSNGEGSLVTQLRMAKFDWSAPGGQPTPSNSDSRT
jgi:hypothetical protein